ncbi:Acyl- N-acyltransferase protein [Rutstroemia sp. NJR-2017a WRK4]|nr:Acyl- N-acyltransferase protein [Rutstroemia sp. NJR-2017a WRK4]
MSSAFSIQPCTPADLPVLTDIWRDSFANDQFLLARWPESQVDPATLYAYVKNAFSKYLETPHTKYWKAVDTSTGAIAGWTHWGMPHTPTEEEKEKERLEKEKEQREKEEGKSKLPAGSNIEICEWKSAGWKRMREKWYRKEDMYLVYFLTVSPSYQRRGIGNLLLSHGLAWADATGQKTYLEATVAGRPLYEKLGFKVVDVMERDLGGELGIGRNWAMIREPVAKDP